MDGIKLLEHLGNGYNGTVFLVEYEGNDVALKLQYGRNDMRDQTRERGIREYGIHCALEGIPGVANPIEPRRDIEGGFESLGIWRLGLDVSDITMSYGFEPFFSGAFLFENFDGLRDISGGVSEGYFDDLRRILDEFNVRGYAFPRDVDFLVRDDNPVLLDLSAAPRLNGFGRYASERMIENSRERIDLLEREYSLAAA